MIKTLLPLLLFGIVFLGYQNEDSKPKVNINSPELPNTSTVIDVLKKFQEPSQLFNVSSSRPTTVKGRKGTVIQVNPDDLETMDGGAVNGTITVMLQELQNTKDMVENNIRTTSDSALLVSGGAYFINLVQGEQQLRLKPNKTITVMFPKLTDDKMTLFYGQKDSSGQMNWKATNTVFTSRKSKARAYLKRSDSTTSDIERILDYVTSGDTMISLEQRQQLQRNSKVERRVYDSLHLERFGWINCDRFFDVDQKTDLLVKIDPRDSVKTANIFLVFKAINSVMQEYYYYKGWSKNGYVTFGNIPVGYKARLIAYSVKEGGVYSFSSDIVVKDAEKLDLPLKLTGEAEFKSLIGH